MAALADHKLTKDEVGTCVKALKCFSTLSLDVELSAGDDGYSLADTLGAAGTSYDTVIDKRVRQGGTAQTAAHQP
ncbi:hypothetical protein ADL02_06825 [Streptomyces sp. NRRL WC-3723]|nr:hypothetical protein ADL02_06825 [Streptomyces sp. NRRL WC-3723]